MTEAADGLRCCPDCGGRGWIWSGHGLDTPDNPYARPDCLACQGRGRLTPERVVALAARYLNAPSQVKP